MNAGGFGGTDDICIYEGRVTISYVLGNASVEEMGMLAHNGNMFPEMVDAHEASADTANGNRAGLGFIQTL